MTSSKAPTPDASPPPTVSQAAVVRVKAAVATITPWEWAGIAALMVLYLVVYFNYPDTPGGEVGSWWYWGDQRNQRRAAEALWSLYFKSKSYRYTIGYALLGTPFVGLMPEHVFLIPNLLLSTGIGVLLYKMARLWMTRVESAVLVGVIIVAMKWVLEQSLIIPWSTIPTHFIAYSMFWLLLRREPSAKLVYQLVVLDGLAYLCRPGDALFLAPLLVAAVIQLPSWRDRFTHALLGMLALAVFPGIDAGFNLLTHGEAVSTYETQHVAGFAFNRLAVTAYVMFLDGLPIYRAPYPMLLERMPWIAIGLPGLIYAARTQGWRIWVWAGTMAFSLFIYIAYKNMSPVGLVQYHLVHYIAWLIPLAGLFAGLTVRHAVRELPWKVWAPALLLPLSIAWCTRLAETDSIEGHVGEHGEIIVDGTPRAGGYDLLVIHGDPEHWAAELERNGIPLKRGDDLHWRRNIERFTLLSGFALHIAEPFQPEEMRFTHEDMPGRRVQLRKLDWQFTLVPPGVMQLIYGDGWGVDSLNEEWIVDLSDVRTDVGVTEETGAIRSNGTGGVLVSGPVFDDPMGHWVVTWYGEVRHGGLIEAKVVDSEGVRRALRLEQAISTTMTPYEPIATFDFVTRPRLIKKLPEPPTLELQLTVDEEVDITVRRIVIGTPSTVFMP